MMLRSILLLCCLALIMAGEAPAEMKRVRELAAGGKSKDEAVAMCIRIAEDTGRPDAERQRARRLVPMLLLNANHADEARAEAARLAAAAPGDKRMSGLAAVVDGMILAKAGKRDEAMASLRASCAADDVLVKAHAAYQLALLVSVNDKGKPAAGDAMPEVVSLAESAASGFDDPWDTRLALRTGLQAAERGKDATAHERILRRLLDEPVLSVIDDRERDDLTAKLGRDIEDGKRFGEARALYGAEIVRAQADLDAVQADSATLDARTAASRTSNAISAITRWRLAIARAWKNEGDIAQTLARCEEVFRADADPSYEWQMAQALVIDCLATDQPRALAAAQTWYEAAGVSDGLKTLARMHSQAASTGDRKADAAREKELTAWLTHGAVGADGVAGTADDLADPGLRTARASYPGRAALARSIPLTTTQQARRRANLLLYAGEPAEAAAVVRWWMSQVQSAPEIGALSDVMGRCSAALSNDPAARRRTLRYLADGPLGPDGKAGTDDDLPDPLPGIAALVVPAPGAEDIALLHRLRDTAARCASDDRAHPHLRGNSLAAVLRIDLLLSTHCGTDELLSWYSGNPAGIMHALYAQRFQRDGHLAGLPEVKAQLESLGFEKQTDWIRNQAKAWADLANNLHSGNPYKGWW
jgi:hypothetical protein